jgi:hypothetical protein
MIAQTLGRGSDGAIPLRGNDLFSHIVWKNNKYRLGIAQERTMGVSSRTERTISCTSRCNSLCHIAK